MQNPSTIKAEELFSSLQGENKQIGNDLLEIMDKLLQMKQRSNTILSETLKLNNS